MRAVTLMFAAAVAAAGLGGPVRADVRIVVPFAAGGPVDAVARLLANDMRDSLGSAVVVDNRPGAGGVIGTGIVAAAPPDGNTVIVCSLGSQVIAAAITGKAPYHPAKSFDAIALLGKAQLILAVAPDFPPKNLKELFELAKNGKLNYGSSGPGSTSHIAGEMLNAEGGVKITHIPYRGSALGINDLIAGQIQMFPGDVGGMLGQLQSKSIRALVVFDKNRSPHIPDVPTAAEQGYPQINMDLWYGLLAPKGLPPAVHAKLEQAVMGAIAKPETAAKLAGMGISNPLGSAEFTKLMDYEAERWPGLVAKMGIKEN